MMGSVVTRGGTTKTAQAALGELRGAYELFTAAAKHGGRARKFLVCSHVRSIQLREDLSTTSCPACDYEAAREGAGSVLPRPAAHATRHLHPTDGEGRARRPLNLERSHAAHSHPQVELPAADLSSRVVHVLDAGNARSSRSVVSTRTARR